MIDYYFIPVFLIVIGFMFFMSFKLEDPFFAMLGGFFIMIMGVYFLLNGIDYQLNGDFNDVVSSGDVTVTGNVTAENVFLPQDIFVHTQTNLSVSNAGDWYNVSFDEEASDIYRGIIHVYNDATNDTFTILESGNYKITCSIAFVDIEASPNNQVVIRFTKNNEEIEGSVWEKDTTKQNAHITMHHFVLVDLEAGDEIRFQFTASDTTVYMETLGTYGNHPDSATLYIEKKR